MNDLSTFEAEQRGGTQALGPFDTEVIGFSPPCGLVGTTVSIAVRNFGQPQAVSFNNVPATEFGGFGTIFAVVPPGATTGKIAVTDTANKSALSGEDFSVTPESGRVTVTGFNPTSAAVGSDVMVFGTNFSAATQVLFAGVASNNFRIDNDNQLTAKVPSPTADGSITVVTKCGGAAVSRLAFNALPAAPVIQLVTPNRAPVGASITLTGLNLTFAPEVKFVGGVDGIKAALTGQTANSITVSVPAGAIDGPITIKTDGGTSATRDPFDVLPPPPDIRNRDGFTPTMGAPGQEVIIFARPGTEFLDLDQTNGVSFKGPNPGQRVPAASFMVLRDSVTRLRDRIKCVVPQGAITGALRVLDSDKQADNSSADFVIITELRVPEAPSNLTASATLNGNIRLTWQDNSKTETGFRLTRTGDGSTAQIQTPFDVTSHTDSNVLPGIAYTYTVVALNAIGASPPSNEASATVGVSGDPIITGVSPLSGTPGTLVSITGSNFDKVARVLFNGIEATFSRLSVSLIQAAVPVGATSGPITLITIDGRQITGPIFTVELARPTNLRASVVGTEIVLNWSDNTSNETGFKVERKAGSGAYQLLATTTVDVTTFADGTVAPGITYCYRVRAFNNAAESVNSNEACAMLASSNVPTISGFTPPSGAPGTQVTIAGSRFAFEDLSVMFNQTEAAVQILSDTQIVATVPVGASSGPIRVTNPFGTGQSAQSFSVGSVLAAPSNLTAAANTASTRIDLRWSDNSSGEAGFKIERKPQLGPVGFAEIGTVAAEQTMFSDANVGAGQFYTYRVKAFGAGGESGFSNTASAGIAQPPLEFTPNAPSNLAATFASNQVNLSWTDNSRAEAGFRIERKTSAAGSFGALASVGSDTTSYVDSTVASGNTYTYRVLAFNFNGDSAFSNQATVSTAGGGGGLLPRIDDFNPRSGAPGSAVSISGVNFNSTAQVLFNGVSANRTVNNAFLITAIVPNAPSGPLSVVTSSGSATAFGNFTVLTGSGGGDTPPAAPSNLSAESAPLAITLRWSDNSANESGFKIERASAGGAFAQIAMVGAGVRSFNDSPLTPLASYTYRVRAFNGAGDSGYSNEVSARAGRFEF